VRERERERERERKREEQRGGVRVRERERERERQRFFVSFLSFFLSLLFTYVFFQSQLSFHPI
jgi:hypothetical protein